MRRRAIVSLIASCALAACAHQTAPSSMAGMSWEATQAGEGGPEAKLAFGAPGTDNVVVMLTCEPKSGRILVSTVEHAARVPPAMTLISSRASQRYPATVTPDMLSEGRLVAAIAPATDPVVANFRDSGELAFTVNGRRTALPNAGADARRFVDSCRA
jgi:hypothetical protein